MVTLTKTIDTLVYDIEQVILGGGGWDKTTSSFFGQQLEQVSFDRFHKKAEPRKHLSLSQIGTPCDRKLWYKINEPMCGEPLSPEAIGTFFYGDMIEALVICLAQAAGHKVEGLQETLTIEGVKGHRDCIIDGMNVDVKSAAKYSFQKFANHQLREDDPFGYISQLSSYVFASQDDPRVTYKTEGAFLVVQKDRFKLCLDRYDFADELKTKKDEIIRTKALVKGEMPEDRIDPVPQSKTSPNTMLSVQCNYCEFRKKCWPEARTFMYSTGFQHLIDVKKEPRVTELIE